MVSLTFRNNAVDSNNVNCQQYLNGQSGQWNATLHNDLSAVDLRRLIGSRAISPVEVMRASLERIADLNPLLVAFCDMRPDAAMAEAREAEAAVMRGDDLPPLHGLPIGIKDMNDVSGLRTTYGSLLFRDNMIVKGNSQAPRCIGNVAHGACR